MNRAVQSALAATLLLAARAPAADDSPSPQHFLQQWATAWQASDVDRMMAFYDTSEQTVAVESRGIVRRGPAQIREMYQGAFDELSFDRVILTPISQGQHGSTAWATCRYKADIRLRSDNSRHVLEVCGSIVMKREKDAWRITLEHFSTIADVPRVRPAG